jgi:hypothetical protein
MRIPERGKRLVAVLLVLGLPLASTSPALAQTPPKADRVLKGKILDENNKPIQKAVVKVRNLDTGEEFAGAPTGSDGSYELSKLTPGRYEVAVQTERGVFLGNRTVDLVKKTQQTYSFALKGTSPEQAMEEARAARGEREEKEKRKGGAVPRGPAGEKPTFWSNPYTAILAGVAIAVGTAVLIDNLQGDGNASPSTP